MRTDQLSFRDSRQPSEEPAAIGSRDALRGGLLPRQTPPPSAAGLGSGRWAVCPGSQARLEKGPLSPLAERGRLDFNLLLNPERREENFQGPEEKLPVIFRRLGFSVPTGSVPYPQHSDTLEIANKNVFLKAPIAK